MAPDGEEAAPARGPVFETEVVAALLEVTEALAALLAEVTALAARVTQLEEVHHGR